MIIDRTLRAGLQGRVTVSHCYALAEATDDEQIEQIARLASADIALTTCVAHDDPLAPVLALASAGVRLGLGSDGIRDLWSPWGNGDLLDRAHQLAYRNSFDADPDIARALDLATIGGAAVLGVDDHGTEVGDVANLVVLDSRSEAEAVVTRASRHLVFKRGVLVARDGVLTPT
jgi:cytosine/creatinine deaminase